MFYGKLIAGLIGVFTGGVFGLLLGLLIGHFFDRGLQRAAQMADPAHLQAVQRSFFDTTFSLLGHLAKADGRISQQEIDHTETLIAQMQLNAEQRQEAIDMFRRGAAPDFALEVTLSEFLQTCGAHPKLQQTLMVFLLSLALVDHQLDEAEHGVLQRISGLLNISATRLEQLIAMARAQESFHQQPGQAPSRSSLADAYTALGVEASATDAQVKRAYRKLMSANHPDKLIAQGVPEDMIRVATEKSQEIQAAYEMIRKQRRGSSG